MRKYFCTRRAGWLFAVALAVASVGMARAAEPPESELDLDLAEPGTIEMPGPPIELSDYWIGLGCYPVQEALRAQLGLAEDQGLAVDQVVADSPAAKAGIQQYDVLVKAGDKPLGGLQDLIDAVDAAKDQELTLDVVRGGKTIQIKVTPEKRPEMPPPTLQPRAPGVPDWDGLRKYFEEFRPGEGGKPPWRLRFWGPGTILPPDAESHAPLPGNMAVTITKAGDEPAKIVVKRGDETWEVTEDTLDQLPDDVRPHLQRMLGGAAPRPSGKVPVPRPNRWSYDFDFVPQVPMPHWEGVPQGRLEKRLEDLNRKMEELHKSLDELRSSRPRLKAPAPQLKETPPDEKEAPAEKDDKKEEQRV
ncbi:MAG: PDZ domain-containing protein [Planctomycetota bacterium]